MKRKETDDFAAGKGRGRQVIAVAKSSDLILMVLDATKSEAANSQYAHKEILTRELEAVGLRLNQTPPQIYIKQKHSGGVQVNNTVPGGGDSVYSRHHHDLPRAFTRSIFKPFTHHL